MEFADNNNVSLAHKQNYVKVETSDHTVKERSDAEISERLAPNMFSNDSSDKRVEERYTCRNRKEDFYR